MRAKRAKWIRQAIRNNYGCVYVDYITLYPRRLYRKCGKRLCKQAKRDWNYHRGTRWMHWW